MFLNKLTHDEKVAFLKLAHYIARSDGDFNKLEKDVIDTYCLEMQIENIEFDYSSFELHSIIEKFKSKKSQKIILLEIMSLIYSDNILHTKEEEVLDLLVNKFKLNPVLTTVYSEWSKAILSLFVQGNALIEL